MTWATVAVGVVGAGVSAYGASQASSANRDALARENDRINALQSEIDAGIENAAALREDRDVPSELFAEIFRRFPGIVASAVPQLTDVASDLGVANAQQFTDLREQITPGVTQLQGDRLDQINALNPNNLGQDEIGAMTRMLAPLLPQGTLNPRTGAVAGATTSPTSLYRNLISSKFSERRTDFLNQSAQFTGEANNAAARNQVSAADFLNTGIQTSLGLAGADIQQQQQDIADQEAYIRLAASGLASTYDPSANNALIAQNTQQGISSLTSAANALASR